MRWLLLAPIPLWWLLLLRWLRWLLLLALAAAAGGQDAAIEASAALDVASALEVVAGMMLWAQLANFVSLPPLLGALPGSHTWVVDHLVAQRMLTLLEDHCII